MLTAWVAANENARSRSSSERLDVDIDLFTFLASLITSLKSPDLLSVIEKAHCTVFTVSCAVFTTAEVVGARRVGLTRLGDIGAIGVRVLLGDACGVEECKREDRTAQGEGKEMTC
jgi:hypothetical protein